MKWQFASVWDCVAETMPEAVAIVHGNVRRTWRDYEARAARLAGGLAAHGLEAGAKVGIYAFNSDAWLEAHYATCKLRGVPVNVNYRYTEHELAYLLGNADVEVLVFDAQFGARVSAILPQLPKLKLCVEIDDGSGAHLEGATPLEALIAAHAPLETREPSDDDIYILYTGGTTGVPKGVMYRQNAFSRMLVMRSAMSVGLPAPTSREELVSLIREVSTRGDVPVSIPACPLMHGTGLSVGVISAHNIGGCAVTFRNEHFDADGLWRLIERERVTDVAIVGDAFAKPMLAALERAAAEGRSFDLGSLQRLHSAGVMFSRETKAALLEFADITITDIIAASEGAIGHSVMSRNTPRGETGTFIPNPATKVFNDRDEEVKPGSDEIGLIASAVLVPLGYHKDGAKSATTFREVRGKLYSFPGDFAKIAADGSLILLGRGSNCINTGGEKVFPEEVEEVLKLHPDITDCMVVGAPDDRFGQRVVAIVSCARPVNEVALVAFSRTRLAGYKSPRRIIFVPEVVRGPNGKADYRWAKATALADTQAGVVATGV